MVHPILIYSIFIKFSTQQRPHSANELTTSIWPCGKDDGVNDGLCAFHLMASALCTGTRYKVLRLADCTWYNLLLYRNRYIPVGLLLKERRYGAAKRNVRSIKNLHDVYTYEYI